MVQFGISERYILSLFPVNTIFQFKGINYKVLIAGKPCPSKGECKTDIYVLTETETKDQVEFKISFKQINADFLENKIKLERAIDILGVNAQEIIKKATKSIRNTFEDDYLVYFKRFKRTKAKCIKLGWKFEFMNKISGEKSGTIPLTLEQKINIYAGTNLPVDKKNCFVNGNVIENSGIANYIIETHQYNQPLNYYLNKMVKIEDYASEQNIYFACKALNYRVDENKWDGDRPLAVYVDWNLINKKLFAEIVYDNPLAVKGNQIGTNVRQILSQLEITSYNFNSLKQFLDENIHINISQ